MNFNSSIDERYVKIKDVYDFYKKDNLNDKMFAEQLRRWLDAVPAITKNDVLKWIPCDEKMPEIDKYEEGQNYLVTVLDKSFGQEQLRVEIRQGFIDGFWKGYYEKDLTILAWMPLPKPYKGGKSE